MVARARAGTGARPYKTGLVAGWTPLATGRGVGSARAWKGREAMWGEPSTVFGRLLLRASGVRKGVGPCRGGVGPRAGSGVDREPWGESVSEGTVICYGSHWLACEGEGVGVYTCVGPFKPKI